jgi:anti-sigma factor RsiW
MTTPHVLDQLPLWVEGDLSRKAMAAVEGHLAECSACRSTAEQLKTSQSWLREAMASPFDASDQGRLHLRVMDQIRAETAAKPSRRFTVRPALLAACAASLLLATLIWRQERGSLIQPPSLVAPPLPKVAEFVAQPSLQSSSADHQATPSPRPHGRPAAKQESESPPQSEPARIEFRTSNPNIRIIWLAQAKPLPDTNPPFSEIP